MTRKQLVAITVTVVALAAAVTAAWLIDTNSTKDGTYVVTVERADKTSKRFDLDALKRLGVKRVVMQGQPQEGPSLLALLDAAGVNQFDSVTVIGQGVRDDGMLRLSRSQVDDKVLLDIAVRGTTKLCGPDIAWDDRVRDVERVVVR